MAIRNSDDEGVVTHNNFFAKLNASIEDAENPQKSSTSTEIVRFLRGDILMSTLFPETEWTVENIIPNNGLVCLSGMPSSYKSWFGFHVALCILKGIPILAEPLKGFEGWKTSKGSVLFIDRENREAQVQKRMKMLGAGEEMKDCYFLQGDFSVENHRSVAEVVKFVREKSIKLVIIDSLIRIHSSNENEAVSMNKVFEQLTNIQDAGAAVMYLHHLRKSTPFAQDPIERLRGSIDISARLDSLIAFENKEKNIITVTHGKSRYTEAFFPFSMRFEIDQHNKAFFNYTGTLEPGAVEQVTCYMAVLMLLKENSYTRAHLNETLKYSDKSIEKAIADLFIEGRIEKRREGKEVIYSYSKLVNELLDFGEKDKEKIN